MKKILCAFVLLFCEISFSQISDLASLSVGTYMSFTPLFDKEEKLFGYLALYYKGKKDDITDKYEYVYLDKNLNKVANNDFTAENSVIAYSSYINTKGEIVLRPSIEDFFNTKKQMNQTIIPKDKVIDVKTNTISKREEICYEDSKFKDCGGSITIGEYSKEAKKENKEKGYDYNSDVTILNDGTYLVYEYKKDDGKEFDKAFIKFDKENKVVWKYEFGKEKKKKEGQYIKILYFDNSYLYFIEYTYIKLDQTFKFVKLALSTGEKVIDEPINGYMLRSAWSLSKFQDINGYVSNKKEFDDKLVLIGEMFDKKNPFACHGYYRMIIDKKTNKVSYANMPFLSAEPFLKDIDAYGNVEKGYDLKIKDIHMLKDGSVGFLFEKFKHGYNLIKGTTPKSIDLVYFATDKDFKIKEVKTFHKDKTLGSYNSDYLFSQYTNEGNDLVFFYRDYQKEEDGEKNWNLFINLIKNGTYTQEKISISSKENTILPYIAKEGYILLREFNKKSKYNGIRLERLNF